MSASEETVRQVLSVLENDTVKMIVCVGLVVYTSFVAPKLPGALAKLFNSKFFNLVLLLLVAALSHFNHGTVALLLAIAVMVSLISLNKSAFMGSFVVSEGMEGDIRPKCHCGPNCDCGDKCDCKPGKCNCGAKGFGGDASFNRRERFEGDDTETEYTEEDMAGRSNRGRPDRGNPKFEPNTRDNQEMNFESRRTPQGPREGERGERDEKPEWGGKRHGMPSRRGGDDRREVPSYRGGDDRREVPSHHGASSSRAPAPRGRDDDRQMSQGQRIPSRHQAPSRDEYSRDRAPVRRESQGHRGEEPARAPGRERHLRDTESDGPDGFVGGSSYASA